MQELTQIVLESNGYSAEGLASKGLREFPPQKIDLVINMSGMIGPLSEIEYQRVEPWNVADPYGEDETTYQRILEEIQGRVSHLARRLRNESGVSR